MKAQPSGQLPPFRLDAADERVYIGDRIVTLRPKTFRLLRYLVERQGTLVTKDELLDAVWPGIHVGDGVLKGCIRELRQALGDDAKSPRFITTVHGRGYRFAAAATGFAAAIPAAEAVTSGQAVGRAREIAGLISAFERARNGDRQIVFISGEPGVGKTTLVHAFVRQIGAVAQVLVGRGECVQHHGAGEPYLPFLEAFTRLCRAPGGGRVAAALRRYAPTWLAHMPSVVDGREIEMLQRQSLGAAAQRMIREMGEAIGALTERDPLVLVLEDLHWSDLSTLDLLAFLARRPERMQLLIVGTYRTGAAAGHPLTTVRQELAMHQRCTDLTLYGLQPEEVREYLDIRCPGNDFARELAALIYGRTEGHPLFMAAIVDDLILRGVLAPTAGGWVWRTDLGAPVLDVPDSVRQMIEGQFAHLAQDDQSLLQAASILGLEFSSAALALAVEDDRVRVEDRCDALARRHLFLQAVAPDELPGGAVSTRYRFVHALHRNVLYEQVPAARRVHLHRQAGTALATLHGDAAADIAAELALHYEEGRDWMRAAAAYLQAARNAARRFAYHEAVQLARRGLDAVAHLPDSRSRARQELMLLTALGSALVTAKTYAAPEVQQVYARARLLCEQVGETPDIFPIMWGLVRFYLVGSPVTTARTLAEEMVAAARRAGDPDVLIHAHESLGAACVDAGDFTAAREQFEACLRLYDPDRHRSHVFLYPQDAGVASHVRGSVALWCLGYPDQAFARAAAGRALARQLAHPFSEALALGFSALLHELARDCVRARDLADATLALSARNGFPTFALLGRLVRAGVRGVEEPSQDAATGVRDALTAAKDAGILLFHVYGHGLQARAWALAGCPDRALAAWEEGMRWAELTGERFYEAEMHRLRGDLHLQMGGRDARSLAEACYRHALTVSRAQQARSWELRASLSLARLYRREQDPEAARDAVAGVLSWFTEGFDSPDLRDARAALHDEAVG